MQFITSSPKLKALGPNIAEILQMSGAAGASIGVLDGATGETHLAGFGDRDVENKLSPDEHTVYHIASLSKSFTAACIALLVADGRLSFEDRICDVLPGFHHHDSEDVRSRSTLLDFLAHRTGLAAKDAVWLQDGHELLLGRTDTLRTVSYLETVAPLGSRWIYNNWGYGLLGEVVAAVSGSTWGEFVAARILKPLRLTETTTGLAPPGEANWAQGYMPGPGGEMTNVGRPVVAAGTVQQGAAGIKSSVRDLLVYYKAVLDAYRIETAEEETDAKKSGDVVLKNVKELLTPRIPLRRPGVEEVGGQWYGAGWVVTELPAPLGSTGTNGMFMEAMPVVGKGCGNGSEKDKTRVWYHNGCLVGFFSSVHVLPDSGTIIVVLVNSSPKNDAADWIGQLLVEDQLNLHHDSRNDYVALAKQSADVYDEKWRNLPREVEKAKTRGLLPSRSLAEYVGRYFNAAGNFFIQVEISHVEEKEEGLVFSFQGRWKTQAHRLEVFGRDAFCWPLTEAQSRARRRWPDLEANVYIFYFGSGGDENAIETLRWVHDPDVPGGEIFVKGEEIGCG